MDGVSNGKDRGSERCTERESTLDISADVRGKGDEAEFIERPLGWFVTCGAVTFEVGMDKPDLSVGDTLELRKREPPNA